MFRLPKSAAYSGVESTMKPGEERGNSWELDLE